MRTILFSSQIKICALMLLVSLQLLAGQRPDIYSFSSTERTELRNLILDYVTANNNAVITQHSTNPSVFHNYDEVFLTWHRSYLAGLENFLMNNGGSEFVPLPAWDPNDCIPNEFFNNAVASGFPALSNRCPSGYDFSRFSNMTTMCNSYSGNSPATFCQRTRTRSIDKFAADLECEHDQVHVSIGGSMSSVNSAPASAIFWLWHAWVDDVYYDYECCVSCCYSSLSLSNCADPFLGVYWITMHGAGAPWSNQQWSVVGGTVQYNYGSNVGIRATSNYVTVYANARDKCGNTRARSRSYYIPHCGYGGFGGFRVTDNEKKNSNPEFSLKNYPNPFSDETVLEYNLAEKTNVSISIFNVTGKSVWEFEQSEMSEGTHQTIFKADNLPNGIYYCKIVAGDNTKTTKLVLQR